MGEDGTVLITENGKPVLICIGKILGKNHTHVLQGKISTEYYTASIENKNVHM